MADGDAGRCEPYRVEWRPSLTARWSVLIRSTGTLGEAEAYAMEALGQHGGQARVVEQRVVLVRGLGQDGGPDQAFIDWQKPPETRHDEFLREHERRIGRVDEAVARLRELTASVRERNERIHGAPRSVVSDPDDRRDVEAAADAGEPMAPACTCTNLDLAPCPAHGPKGTPTATATDMAGCAHRMSSGAVSLTACGECGAQPGDDCADPLGWRVHRPAAVRLGVLHPPAGADRLSWHAWLDELGVPRHTEPEQQTDTGPKPLHQRRARFHMPSAEAPVPFGGEQTATDAGPEGAPCRCVPVRGPTPTLVWGRDGEWWRCDRCGGWLGKPADDEQTATAPASCTERMHWWDTTNTRALDEALGHLCPECNAQPREPCADPLEDRIAWRVKQTGWQLDGTSTVELYWQRLAEDHGRRAAHENLDLTGVPRHGTRAGDQASDTTEAERVLDASPFRKVPRRSGAVDDVLAEHGKPHGPDPWWRRLLHRTRR